ncbi:MAG: tRNA (N6-threonylcarbamoyladenosine(37)-N6)-methyltransferase TrmO [Candidatus Zhuqueibacterota bacterium]
MSGKIEVTPIGIIRTPYTEPRDIPIQGTFKADVEGWIELAPEYEQGLKDLGGFSHVILIYYFHRTREVKLQAKPYLEDAEHGIFAIRSSNRPNHLGLSIVKVVRIEKNVLFFSEVDMLDGTPLLDIKPYCRYFDSRENTVCGWIEKHFENNQVPERTILH